MNENAHKVMATGTVLLGMFIAAMESLIASTILPSIISSLGGIDLYPWVISSFLLALVVATPLFGKLADHIGFFKVYVVALIFFCIGSLFCGISRTMLELIISRSIQGIGTAGLITLCLLYIGIAHPLRIRHKMQALVSSMWAIASLIGPALGAFIVAISSWRFTFLINIPLCVLILFGAFFFLRGSPRAKTNVPFDKLGAFLFTISAFAFLFSMVQLGKLQFKLQELLLLVFSLSIAGVLIWRGRWVKGAFLSITPLQRRPVLSTSMGLGFLGGAFLFATANFLPLFVQGVQGDSIGAVSQVVTGMALGTCAGSFITALILSQMGFRVTALMGSLFLTSGLVSLTLLSEESSLFMVTLANFLTGVGIGISANGAIVATQSYTHINRLGVTTSMFSFFRSIGGMLAISLLGTIQLSSFRHDLSEKAIGLYQADALQVLQHPEYILEPLQRPFLSEAATSVLAESLKYSLKLAFIAMIPLLFIHFWLSSRMPNIHPHEIEPLPEIEAMGE